MVALIAEVSLEWRYEVADDFIAMNGTIAMNRTRQFFFKSAPVIAKNKKKAHLGYDQRWWWQMKWLLTWSDQD